MLGTCRSVNRAAGVKSGLHIKFLVEKKHGIFCYGCVGDDFVRLGSSEAGCFFPVTESVSSVNEC